MMRSRFLLLDLGFLRMKAWPARLILLGLLAHLAACAPLDQRTPDAMVPLPKVVMTESYLTIGYGASEAEARSEALQKALRRAAAPWSSPEFGTDRKAVTDTVLDNGGAEFIHSVSVRLSGQSGPSSFVLAEVEVDQSEVFQALDLVVTGPGIEPPPPEPEPVDWLASVAERIKSFFGFSSPSRSTQNVAGRENPDEDEQAPRFVPIAGTEPGSGYGAFEKGLTHYYVDPFSNPRDYLMADVTAVDVVPGSLEGAGSALRIFVSMTPHKQVIDRLQGFLEAHGLGEIENPRCLVFAPNSEGEEQFYAHRGCRRFTKSYPQSISMLALNFVGESGVVGTLMLGDDPFRVGFGERYLEKYETLYVRHSDREYAAWAWRPDVRRARGRDSDYHVMPYATLECGEDRVGTCTDWSRRYRIFLGVHGGTEQKIRFILENMPSDVLSKTKMVLAEVVEVRKGEVISDMLPPGVMLIPEDPLPPLSHPLDRGVYGIGRSY